MPSPVYNGARDFLIADRGLRITKYLVYSSLFCALKMTHHGPRAMTGERSS